MEYERQSREQRQAANIPISPSGATLTGPVGFRHRTTNVANKVQDQATVISLLSEIPVSKGGKKGAWPVVPLTGGDGQCPKILVDAIWEFQDHWYKAGVFKRIDGVVDPGGNTLKHMNALASRGGGDRVMPIDPKPPNRTGFPYNLFSRLKPRFTNWKIDGTATVSMSYGPVGVAGAKMKLANKLNPGSLVPLLMGGFGLSFGPDEIPGGLEIAPSSFPSWGSPVHAGPRARSENVPIEDLLGNCLLLGLSLGAGATAEYALGGNATVVMFNVGSNRPLSSLPHDAANVLFGSSSGYINDCFNTCMGWATTIGQFAGFSVGVSMIGGMLIRDGASIRPDPSVRR